MLCSTSIVECLRKINIEPKTFARTANNNVKHALIYDISQAYHSTRENIDQYWGVDFKKTIALHSYQIKTGGSYCSWITKWIFSISMDNKSYIPVDSPPQGYPDNTIFSLNKTYNTRYIRIDGSTPGCSSSSDPKAFAFYYVKFFGSIFPIMHNINTCKCLKIINTILMRIIIIIISS